MKKEFIKSNKDAKKLGLGVYDPILKKRIDITKLAFIWPCPAGKLHKPPKLRKEIELRSRLQIIKKVFQEKFGKDTDPYDLKLFKKDEGLFVERLIRAVEICTMNYVLNLPGGSLNLNKCCSIIKGRKKFVWED